MIRQIGKISRLFGATLLLVLMVFAPITVTAQADSPLTSDLDPAPVVQWVELLRQRIWAEGTNPALSARIYGYVGVTIYESLIPGMPEFRSLVYQANGLPDLPYWDEDELYDWLSTTNAALHTVITGLMFEASAETREAFDALREAQAEARRAEVGDEIVARSLVYGEELGAGLLDWIANDNYKSARQAASEYVLPTAEEWGLVEADDYVYVQTNPDMPLVEPGFGTVRTIGLENRYECIVDNNLYFSTDPESAYYQQAMEVFETSNNLTADQREMAEFWIDTPGDSSTPAGHWMSIANQLVEQLDLTLDRAAMMYGMLGMVLHDSFVVGFGIKYETLTMRPQTYINRFISRRWQSYLATPQFPEYPSNHSIVSAAAADMLTSLFDIVPFTDMTAAESLGLVRSFLSFEHAADEAAMSRLYGGIHYRTAIENGKRIGRCIAEKTLERIVMLPIAQGE
ncbi:MAG: vanadium-dependent haloperoxidase [Chloroflexi bacterium]|nr:vanadium-dependent haloperoxidase [Chloroflexota bacterium]